MIDDAPSTPSFHRSSFRRDIVFRAKAALPSVCPVCRDLRQSSTPAARSSAMRRVLHSFAFEERRIPPFLHLLDRKTEQPPPSSSDRTPLPTLTLLTSTASLHERIFAYETPTHRMGMRERNRQRKRCS